MRSLTLRKAKQKGFTLLELLVVITLLAILAVGALVAYEGIGDTAQATAASNNTARADQMIRNYKAVTQSYPDQWDNLVVAGDGSASGTVATTADVGTLPRFFHGTPMTTFLAPFDINGAANKIRVAFEAAGIGSVQTRLTRSLTTGVEPNLQHNEGAIASVGASDVIEADIDSVERVAIVPTFGSAACSVNAIPNGGTTASTTALPTTTVSYNRATDASTRAVRAGISITAGSTTIANGSAAAIQNYLNKVNDSLETGTCHLVVALGFGHDAAQSTSGSSVAISAAPTYASANVNPNTTYARYIGLFHVGEDDGANGAATAADNVIDDAEIFSKPRLIAVVDTEGHVIDQNIAASTDETAN